MQVRNPNVVHGNSASVNSRGYRGDPNSSMARSIQEQLSKAQQREQEEAAAKRAKKEADATTSTTEGAVSSEIPETPIEGKQMMVPPPPSYPPPVKVTDALKRQGETQELEEEGKKKAKIDGSEDSWVTIEN